MTYLGAIKQLQELKNAEDMPFYYKPAIAEVINVLLMDAQEVKHGHWIHDGFDNPHGVDWMHCSECGKRDVYCPVTMTNYCSGCGARMDGKTE